MPSLKLPKQQAACHRSHLAVWRQRRIQVKSINLGITKLRYELWLYPIWPAFLEQVCLHLADENSNAHLLEGASELSNAQDPDGKHEETAGITDPFSAWLFVLKPFEKHLLSLLWLLQYLGCRKDLLQFCLFLTPLFYFFSTTRPACCSQRG